MASSTSHLSTRGFSGRFRAGLAAAAVAATAALVAGCAPPSPLGQGDNPSGAVDSVYLTDGGVVVSGWASDRNSAAPVEVVFTVAGRLRPERITASVNRPDLGALTGHSERGYSIYLPIPGATAATAVCVSAINVGPGASSLLGCRRAVDSAPVTPPTLPPPPPPVSDWLAVGGTGRVSVATDGAQGNGSSSNPAASSNGRYVAYDSSASNLVSGDTNFAADVFVYDTLSGTTTRVSVASDGTQGNGPAYNPAISADGRYVAFQSYASNLVPGDTNGVYDVFVRDTVAGTTTLVSVASDGTQAENGVYDPSISADGRYVAFDSGASNLVPGDTNGVYDAFVRDTVAGTTTLVSATPGGVAGNDESDYPAISADGRYVAFESNATDLSSGDASSSSDIYIRDITAGTTTLVSATPGWVAGNNTSSTASVSDDGRFVAFSSKATDLVAGDNNVASDVFVRDTVAGTTTRVSVTSDGSQASSASYTPSISDDGRYVSFWSWAPDLVPGDTNGKEDVFVRDTAAGATTRVSVAADGTQGDGSSFTPSISPDGRYVVFRSAANNLIAGETGTAYAIYAHRIR